MNTMYFNILDYGASAKNPSNTTAIQKAIDTAAAAGGGTVFVPTGRYHTGALNLKDNITLLFDAGAELFASTDRADYPPTIGRIDSRYRHDDGSEYCPILSGLLCCRGVKNVSIKGGQLLTDDRAFWEVRNDPSSQFEPALEAEAWYYYKANPWRISMIMLEDSDNISVEGMSIVSYPAYAVWGIGCNKLTFRDLNFHGEYAGPNTDGIHLSSCTEAIITGCRFVCGDDCVALDGNHHGPCTDIMVSDCYFDSSVHPFRIFTGLDPYMKEIDIPSEVHRVSITNCTIGDANGIFNINAHNGTITDISATNITARLIRESNAVVISTQNGQISRIRFSDMTVDGNGCALIQAEKMGDISGIRFYNCDFVVTPKTKIQAMPSISGDAFPNHCHYRANHFYFKRVNDVTMRNIHLSWNKPIYSDSWDPERREKLIARIAPRPLSDLEPTAFPAVEISECTNISIADCVLPDFSL